MKFHIYATFNQDLPVFGTTCLKYMQKHYWKEHLCVLQIFLSAGARALSLEGTLLTTHMGHLSISLIHSFIQKFIKRPFKVIYQKCSQLQCGQKGRFSNGVGLGPIWAI